jgi:hypothetical protein
LQASSPFFCARHPPLTHPPTHPTTHPPSHPPTHPPNQPPTHPPTQPTNQPTTHPPTCAPTLPPCSDPDYDVEDCGYYEDYPLLLGSDLAAAARALPNLADLEVYQARVSGGVPAPLAALTRLSLDRCGRPEGGAPLRIDGDAAPRLQVLDAQRSDASCGSCVAGHPAVRELLFGGQSVTFRDCIRVWTDCAPMTSLTKLRAGCVQDEDGDDCDGPDFLGGLLAAALRLPAALRSLDVTFVPARTDGGEALSLDKVMAALGCAVGGRLRELSLVLNTVSGERADSARNAYLLLPAFPRLESLRLGCWEPAPRYMPREPTAAVAMFGILAQQLAAARALTPSLRAVELVLSYPWRWCLENDEAVARLVRANPGLTICFE